MGIYRTPPGHLNPTEYGTIRSIRIKPMAEGLGISIPGFGANGHCTHDDGPLDVGDELATDLIASGRAEAVQIDWRPLGPRVVPPPPPRRSRKAA